MAAYFSPYEGNSPYLFVSYSHRDTERVLASISPLRERALRLWYDEGIPAGSDWPRNIADHLASCDSVLFFASAASMASPNCENEIAFAKELGKGLYALPLDGTEPKGVWEALLEDAVWLDAQDGPDGLGASLDAQEGLAERLQGTQADYAPRAAGQAGRSIWTAASFVAGAAAVASLAFLGALAAGIVSPFAPAAEPVPEPEAPAAEQAVDLSAYGDIFVDAIVFPDEQQERAVRAALGAGSGAIGRERLLDISELCFAGNLTPASAQAVSFTAEGELAVNGVPAMAGRVTDLSLIADMPYLETLVLAGQPLDALDGLSGHRALGELWLAGSSVEDLSCLADLPSLTDLHLEHTQVADLSALASLPSLRRVYVSAEMLPLDLASLPFDVVLVL